MKYKQEIIPSADVARTMNKLEGIGATILHVLPLYGSVLIIYTGGEDE